jgi:ATP-binding cassette subfamily C protein
MNGREPPVLTAARAWAEARRLYFLLPARLRRSWIALLVLGGLCSAAELLMAAVILSMTRVATGAGGEAPAVALPWATFQVSGLTSALLATAVVGAVFFLRGGLTFALSAATATAGASTAAFIGESLFSHYVWMPYARFRPRGVAELQRRVLHLSNEVVERVLRPTLVLLADGLVIGAVLVVMVAASPRGTLIAAALVLTTSVLLIRMVHPRLYRLSLRIDAHERAVYTFVEQVLHGRREITLRGHEAAVVASYREEREAIGAAIRRRAPLLELPRLVLEAASMTVLAGLLVAAVGLGLDRPGLLATLGLFGYAMLRLNPLAARIASSLSTLRSGLPILDAVLQDLVAAGTQHHEGPDSAPSGRAARSRSPCSIELRDVSSCYEGARRPALRDVTVRIEPGSFVAVVGPSGSGKSTLVDLLLGLLSPTFGEVLVDGHPLAALGPEWRSRVGVVSQEPYVFNDSIRRNVALFGNGDEARLRQVLQDVGLLDYVETQRDGLITLVGERGSGLSGGQRQRLAIARALYLDPDLLVLDEATSALDPEGEAQVLDSARRSERSRTVVVVTHRPSAIAGCDQVIVLERGRLTSAGTHADVRRQSPFYAQLLGSAERS